jgi:hypothetical protein
MKAKNSAAHALCKTPRMLLKVALYALLIAATVQAHAQNWQGLPIQVPVRDQCDTSACWAHATLSSLDVFASEKYNEPISFNIDFLLMQELKSRALANFLGHQGPLKSGGNMLRALALALEHGLIPEKDWTPKNRVVLNHAAIIAELEELLAKTKGQPLTNASKDLFCAQMDALFERWLGTPPETVTVAGRQLNRVELARDLLAKSLIQKGETRDSETHWVIDAKSDNFIWEHIITRDNVMAPIEKIIAREKTSAFTSEEALERIGKLVHAGIPVLLGIATRDKDLNLVYRTDGKFKNYYAPSMGPQDTYRRAHLLMVTDVKYDDQGHVAALRVQNSHGVQDGANGYREMTLDFFKFHAMAFHEMRPPWKVCEKGLL